MSSGAWFGDVAEWLGFNNKFSSAGKEREAAKISRNFNSAEAEKQRNWQDNLTRNAVSIRASDMKNAGINPIMAAGSAAQVPSGATASSVPARQGGGQNMDLFTFLSKGTSAVKQITGQQSAEKAFNSFTKVLRFI